MSTWTHVSTRPAGGRRAATLGALLLLAAAPAAPAAAQGIRTVEIGRPLGDATTPLHVRVSHDVGTVVLHGTDDRSRLYQVALAYDPQRSRPVYQFDTASRTLHVGLGTGEGGRGDGRGPELRLDLARNVPLDLQLDMGAAEADLDLGGMSIQRLGVESGASAAVVHFDSPNATEMQLLSLDVGAASLSARGLGNARAREVRVSVGIGSADLEFGGEWANDVNLDLQVALGTARLSVPEEVGIRVDLRRFLAGFEREGFERRGDSWYSANWDSAPRKLHVRARTVLGDLEIDRR